MKISQMKYIVTLAEKRNLADAAGACFISESALCQSLSRLEHTLGTKLFMRHTHKWTPTAHGKLFLAFAAEVLSLNDNFMKTLHSDTGGTGKSIRLGIAPERGALLFPRMYSRFSKEFPNLPVRLSDQSFFELQQHLIEGELDYLITVGPLKHQRELRRRLMSKPFFSEDLVLVVSPSHRFAQRARKKTNAVLPIEELANENFICHCQKKVLRHFLDDVLKQFNVTPKERFEVSSSLGAIDFVSNGLGVAFVPKMFAVSNPSVCIVPLSTIITWDLSVIYRREKRPTPEEQRMLAILAEEQQKLSDWGVQKVDGATPPPSEGALKRLARMRARFDSAGTIAVSK